MNSIKQPTATASTIGYLVLGVIVLISSFKPTWGISTPVPLGIAYLLAQATLAGSSGLFHATFDSNWRHWYERGMYAVFNMHLAILIWQVSGSVWVPLLMGIILTFYMGYVFYDLSTFVILPILVMVIFFLRWSEGESLLFIASFVGALCLSLFGYLFDSESEDADRYGDEKRSKRYGIYADIFHGLSHPFTLLGMYLLLI